MNEVIVHGGYDINAVPDRISRQPYSGNAYNSQGAQYALGARVGHPHGIDSSFAVGGPDLIPMADVRWQAWGHGKAWRPIATIEAAMSLVPDYSLGLSLGWNLGPLEPYAAIRRGLWNGRGEYQGYGEGLVGVALTWRDYKLVMQAGRRLDSAQPDQVLASGASLALVHRWRDPTPQQRMADQAKPENFEGVCARYAPRNATEPAEWERLAVCQEAYGQLEAALRSRRQADWLRALFFKQGLPR